MAIDGSTRAADKKRQKTLGIKAFFDLGRHSHLLNKSTEGLVEERHADGSVSVDLQGRFEHVTVARKNQDGTVSQSCVDNPRAAAAFYKIDPKLLQSDQPTVKKPLSNPGNN